MFITTPTQRGFLKNTESPSSTPGWHFSPLCVYFITLDRHFLFSACLANAIPSGVMLSGRITPQRSNGVWLVRPDFRGRPSPAQRGAISDHYQLKWNRQRRAMSEGNIRLFLA